MSKQKKKENIIQLNQKEIEALQRKRQRDIANLVIKYNRGIKTICNGSEIQYYIWKEDDKLYVTNDKQNKRLKLAVSKTLEFIIQNAHKSDDLSEEDVSILLDRLNTNKFLAAITSLLNKEPEKDFVKYLNNHPYYLPIKNGRKIDIRTKQISTRTMDDYWSFELDWDYLPNLEENENVFAKFVKDILPDENEYKFLQQVMGYIMSTDNHENILVIFAHPKGGGGKSIFISIIHMLFEKYVTKLTRDVILHGKGNLGAELNKINNCRVAYIDEALDQKTQQKGIKKKKLILDVLLDITGGGIREDRDSHQRGKEVKMQLMKCKLILLGNDNLITCHTHPSINRRIVYFALQYYFRCEDDTDWDPNDPFCKLKNENIQQLLQDNMDHAFTWIINCINLYYQNKPNFKKNPPPRFIQAWKDTAIETVEYQCWKSFVEEYIWQYDNQFETLTDIRNSINQYKSSKKIDINNYTNESIKAQLQLESKMELKHSHQGQKKVIVMNCKLKTNLHNIFPQQSLALPSKHSSSNFIIDVNQIQKDIINYRNL